MKKPVLVIASMSAKEAALWNAFNVSLQKKNFEIHMIFYGKWGAEDLPNLNFKIYDFRKIAKIEKYIGFIFPPIKNSHVNLVANYVKDTLNPVSILLWNGLNDVWLEWRLTLENLELSYCIAEKSGFNNIYQFESKGINGLSDLIDYNNYHKLKTDQKLIYEIYQEIIGRKKTNGVNLIESGSLTTLAYIKKKYKRIIVFFGIWDEAAGLRDPNPEIRKLQSPHYTSSFEAALELIKIISNQKDIALIIKQHPQDKNDWSKIKKNQYKNIFFINKIDPLQLIEVSNLVTSISSSLTFESTLYSKPTLLLGINPLSNKGYVYDLTAKGDLKHIISNAMNNNLTDRIIKRDAFFQFYFTEFCYTADEELIKLGVQNINNAVNKILIKKNASHLHDCKKWQNLVNNYLSGDSSEFSFILKILYKINFVSLIEKCNRFKKN